MTLKARISLVLLTLSTSCGWVGEPVGGATSFLNQSSGLSCLATLPDQLSAFVEGTLQHPSQANQIAQCVDAALEQFSTTTRGTDPKKYTAEELRNFLNRYFTKEKNVSPEFMEEVMKVKSSLLGGDSHSLTREELKRSQKFFRTMGKEMERVAPFMPLEVTHLKKMSTGETLSAAEAILVSADTLGTFLEDAGNDYSFENAARLLREFERFLSGDFAAKDIRSIRELVPVVRSLKTIAVGGSSQLILKNEWARFLRTSARLHGLYLLSQHFMKPQLSWLSPEGLDILEEMTRFGSRILVEVAQQIPNGTIGGEQVQALIATLKELKGGNDLEAAPTIELMSDLTAKALSVNQLLVGGQNFEIYTQQLALIPDVVSRLRTAVTALASLLEPNQIIQLPEEDFQKRMSELDGLGKQVGDALTQIQLAGPGRSDIRTVRKLIQQVEPLLIEPTTLKQQVNLISSFIRFLAGQSSEAFRPESWGKTLARAGGAYRVYLKARRTQLLPPSTALVDLLRAYWGPASEALNLLEQIASASPLTAERVSEMLTALPPESLQSLLGNAPTIAEAKDLVNGFFELKRVLSGGSNQQILPEEVKRLSKLAALVQEQALIVAPWVPDRWEDLPYLSEVQSESLAKALENAGLVIGGAIHQSSPSSYRFEDLSRLIDRIDPLFPSENLRTIRDYLPLIGAAKEVVVAPPSTEIRANEWGALISRTAGWMALAIRGTRQVHLVNDPFSRKDIDAIQRILAPAFELLAKSASAQGEISLQSINQLVDEVYSFRKKSGRPDWVVTLGTAKLTLKAFIQRWLNTDIQSRNNLSGLTREGIQRAQHILIRYQTGLATLDDLMMGEKQITAQTLIKRIEALRTSTAFTPTRDQAAIDLHQIVKSFPPLFLGNDSTLSIPYLNTSATTHYSYNHLSRMTFFWVLGRLLLESYTSPGPDGLRPIGATREEFATFINDFFPVMKELSFVDPRQTAEKVVTKRFREAELFMWHSNGNNLFELGEGIGLLSMAFSVKPVAKEIYEYLLKNCPHDGLDPFGQPKIEIQCFRTVFHSEAIMGHLLGKYLPGFAEQYRYSPRWAQEQFEKDLETVAKKSGFDNEAVELDDVESYAMVPFYIESLMARFDTNLSSTLSVREAVNFYPVVCRELRAAANTKTKCEAGERGTLETIFGYLLKHGAPPQSPDSKISIGENLSRIMNYLGWSTQWWAIRKVNAKGFETDRLKIMSILAILSQQ